MNFFLILTFYCLTLCPTYAQSDDELGAHNETIRYVGRTLHKVHDPYADRIHNDFILPSKLINPTCPYLFLKTHVHGQNKESLFCLYTPYGSISLLRGIDIPSRVRCTQDFFEKMEPFWDLIELKTSLQKTVTPAFMCRTYIIARFKNHVFIQKSKL